MRDLSWQLPASLLSWRLISVTRSIMEEPSCSCWACLREARALSAIAAPGSEDAWQGSSAGLPVMKEYPMRQNRISGTGTDRKPLREKITAQARFLNLLNESRRICGPDSPLREGREKSGRPLLCQRRKGSEQASAGKLTGRSPGDRRSSFRDLRKNLKWQ